MHSARSSSSGATAPQCLFVGPLLVGLVALVAAAVSCADDESDRFAVGGSGGTTAHGAGGLLEGGAGMGAGAPGGMAPGGGPAGGSSTGGTSSGGDAPGGTGSAAGGSGGAGQGGAGCTGPVGQGTGPCAFPQGVPDDGFIASACSYGDTDPVVDAAVNAVMVTLTGCGVSSDCPITGFAGTTTEEICQSWFAAVTEQLRAQGYCAGQHEVGYTDEIAVSGSGCDGKWYGYHICNYGGPKVVWNPGARRGWWAIDPGYCP